MNMSMSLGPIHFRLLDKLPVVYAVNWSLNEYIVFFSAEFQDISCNYLFSISDMERSMPIFTGTAHEHDRWTVLLFNVDHT
jgi:hypothetical protein